MKRRFPTRPELRTAPGFVFYEDDDVCGVVMCVRRTIVYAAAISSCHPLALPSAPPYQVAPILRGKLVRIRGYDRLPIKTWRTLLRCVEEAFDLDAGLPITGKG